ncbi:hypothetical protein M569_00489, partial [Genlisea aurea]
SSKKEVNIWSMLEAAHEISIYIHRFHNLDLFQQGWYQLKITMRWEEGDSGSNATPARVVQYDVPELGSDDVYGVWRIDDADHSFSTQPFRIKYARQDILLSMMVSFNLSLSKLEGPSLSAVILKFELLFTPVLLNRSDIHASFGICPAAVHEFRLPSKALLGIHAYCPVHFDAFHAVLVDTTVHASLIGSSFHTSSLKDPRGNKGGDNRGCDASKQAKLIKSLLSARDILLEEIQKLSKGINKPIDIEDLTSTEFFNFIPKSEPDVSHHEAPEELTWIFFVSPQKSNGDMNFGHADALQLISDDMRFKSFDFIGNQMFYIWSVFLNFHRANVKKILEFLLNQWAFDRKAEWSIWMVYTKVEMPHQYISTAVESTNFRSRSSPFLKKLTDQPAQTAAMRAQLHRRSIAQMKINNRSIQDMHMFGEPSRVPIVIVERVVNAPVRSMSGNSYFSQLDQKDSNGLNAVAEANLPKRMTSTKVHQIDRILKVVVFVHGFQGHHLDLRLVRNQWLLIDPKVECLMSEVNEEKTSGDLREMGRRLAEEVVSFVKKKMDKVSRSGILRTIKLSFVGHSIGNIILRAALTESVMEPYLRFLHTYVSVSGPHLGYLYSSNSLFNGGMWLLKKLKGTQCIHQLTLTDDPDLHNTFLYNLCKQRTLENFRNIILVSSPQDGYVPYHSARIEMSPAASFGDESKKGKVFVSMLNNLVDQIRAPWRSAAEEDGRVVLRCDVNFDVTVQGRNLNTIIGRAAHIEFLESDIFVKFVMWSFRDL